MTDEKFTPREKFEVKFGPIDDDQWQWLKEFCAAHFVPEGGVAGRVDFDAKHPAVHSEWISAYRITLLSGEKFTYPPEQVEVILKQPENSDTQDRSVDWNIDENLPTYTRDLLRLAEGWIVIGNDRPGMSLADHIRVFANQGTQMSINDGEVAPYESKSERTEETSENATDERFYRPGETHEDAIRRIIETTLLLHGLIPDENGMFHPPTQSVEKDESSEEVEDEWAIDDHLREWLKEEMKNWYVEDAGLIVRPLKRKDW